MAWLTWEGFYTAATNLATGLAGAGAAWFALRKRYSLDSSQIKQERSNAHAGAWLNDALIAQATKAETERDATMRAAKELLDQRMVDVERIARQEEKLANCERQAASCEDRAQRAEARAAVAEEHMRKQAEQMLVQSMNIDSLTTELAKHDQEAAARLAPKRKQQPLLTGPEES